MGEFTTAWTASICFEGANWKPQIVDVSGTSCVKLVATDFGFVSFMCRAAGLEHVKASLRPTLAHCAGLQALVNIRNAAQTRSLMPVEKKPDEELFGGSEHVPPPKKKTTPTEAITTRCSRALRSHAASL